MDEDQSRTLGESARFDLLLECQQRFAGIQRFQGNAAGLPGLFDELKQQRIDLGEATATGLKQLIRRIDHTGFLHDPLDLLRHPMIVRHRQRPENRMITGFGQYQPREGRAGSAGQPPAVVITPA
ncbi:hypothetical protein D3C73_1283850 [compost metagenome]